MCNGTGNGLHVENASSEAIVSGGKVVRLYVPISTNT